jgi:hypothetical protein
MERSSGGKAVQRTLGSDERISRKKSGPGAGGVKRRGRHSLVYRADMGTDTIDQIAKAEIVPVAGNRKNCEVPHIRAAEIGAKVRVRASAVHRVQPMREPARCPHRAGFRH